MSPFGKLEQAQQESWSDDDENEEDDVVDDEKIDEGEHAPVLVHQATQWITHQMRPIDKEYHIDVNRPLGEPGQFGTAYACWKHPTNFERNSPDWEPELRCVKVINKVFTLP